MIRQAIVGLWVALLLLPMAARGQENAKLKVGDYAPDIEAKDWLNTDGDKASLKDYRGMMVVLFFWVSFHKGGEAYMESISTLYNHRAIGRERGVMVMGVTDADRVRVDPVIRREKLTFPVALESESYKEYGIPTFPYVVVIDPDGKVVFLGNPGDVSSIQTAIFESLAKNPPSRTRPEELIVVRTSMEEARNALRDRSYVRAFNGARKALEYAVTGDPIKSSALDLLEVIELIARDRLAQVEQAVDDKDFAKAIAGLRDVLREFRGTDAARDARKRLASLRKDYKEVEDLMKKQQATMEAAKLLGEARQQVLSQDFGAAYERIQKILDSYKQTEVAPVAEGLLRRMEADDIVKAELRDFRARAACEPMIAQARNFIASGRRKEAQELLYRIVREHPETRFEKEASKLLIELR